MSRHYRIFEVAAAGLLRNRARTLAVVAVYALLVGLVASLLLFVGALRGEARLMLRTAPEIVVQRLTAGRHELMPVERAAGIARIRGVSTVTPRVWGYYYDPPSDATLTFWGADSVPEGSLDYVHGDAPPLDRQGFVVVGQGISEARLLMTGERFPIRGSDGTLFAPRVAGVFTTASSLLTHDLVVMGTTDLRRVFGIPPDRCTDLAVRVHNPHEVATVALKIQQSWPDVRVISRKQILQTYDAVFDWRGGVWAAGLLGAVLAFGILVWDKATGLSAEEYRTIGVLKAVGWSPREVMELKAWEGAIVSVTALLTGILLAQVHLLGFDGVLFSRVLRGWSVLFPSLEPAPRLDAYTLLACLPLAVIPYVAAGLLPAWRAAVTDPDSVMRS